MRQFKKQPKYPKPINHKTAEERTRLMAKSMVAFGRANHYKSVMKRGIFEPQPGAPPKYRPISLQEIEDTMDYIIEERKKQDEQSKEVRQRETNDEPNTTDSIEGSSEGNDVRSE